MAKKPPHFPFFSGLIIGLSVIFLLLAYSNRSQGWLIALFAIPFVVQIRGIWIVSKIFASSNAKGFCWFYLITMAVCFLSYCILWNIYASWETQYHWVQPIAENWFVAPASAKYLSYLALIIIGILLLFVIRMTRAIIEGRFLRDNKHNSRYDREIQRRCSRGQRFRHFVKPWNLNNLRTGASNEPFLTLAFFFTVFLGISYLFGLALAFHDKGQKPDTPALYMRNLNPRYSAKGETATNPSPTPAPIDGSVEFTFKFIEGLASVPLPDVAEPDYSVVTNDRAKQAQLKKDWRDAGESNDSKLFAKDDLRDAASFAEKLRGQRDSLSSYLFSQLGSGTRQLLKQHVTGTQVSESLQGALLDDLNKLIEGPSLFKEERFKDITLSPAALILVKTSLGDDDSTRLNRMLLAEAYSDHIAKNRLYDLIQTIQGTSAQLNRIRVTIVGFSDASQVKGTPYKSNYELAEARAQNTKQVILDRLGGRSKETSWDNIEWSSVSLSNEPHASEKIVKVKLESAPQDSASLLLKSEHPNPLNLLDYVYFANYTITTTGYGDIVPTTAYAKFICSFANIVEVFFLVVFFNVLVSLRRSTPTRNLRLRHRDVEDLVARIRRSKTPPEEENKESMDGVGNADLTKLKRHDSETRTKIKRIEAAMKEKADRVDIDVLVKDAMKRFWNPLNLLK
jgi:hypothetical protein